MSKIGLIAGGGRLPLEFVRSAGDKGDEVVVFALEGMASEELNDLSGKVRWMNIGQTKKFVFLLLKERIKKLVMVGKVNKNTIYEKDQKDRMAQHLLKKGKNKKDYAILEKITRYLDRVGITVISPVPYLKHLIPEAGVLGEVMPDKYVLEDMEFGYEIAKNISEMDIGQTVIVKDKAVVAVEAMEGTDDAIERSKGVAGEGCVMIKVSRPNQDLRWDIPTVGSETITKLAENSFAALAIESGKMFLLEKEKLIGTANSNNIAIKVL